jgi:hypothetical protein
MMSIMVTTDSVEVTPQKEAFQLNLSTILKELKVDVGGYEWPFLDAVDWNDVRFGHFLMEWHPSPNGKKFLGRNPPAKEMNEIFNELERAGLFLNQSGTSHVHKFWTSRSCLHT